MTTPTPRWTADDRWETTPRMLREPCEGPHGETRQEYGYRYRGFKHDWTRVVVAHRLGVSDADQHDKPATTVPT